MMAFPNILKHTIAKILVLAVLYIVTGKIGLLLALPPGYATVIWPPSGIALGMLIIYGWRLWPGILIGSFLLNCYISGAYSPETGFLLEKTITAFGIATGSTLQALAGCALISKFVGLPLNLKNARDILKLFIISGPLSCLIAASAAISVLYFSGVLPLDKTLANWVTWWLGDTFGVLVFMPLVLMAPTRKDGVSGISWRGNKIAATPAVAMLVILMSLGLTFYAWKISAESVYEQANAKFESLAIESEKALLHRLDTYENALLGGEGFFKGSTSVERAEWESYVQTIDVAKNFPGMNGIGWIKPVKPEELSEYIKNVQLDGAPDFEIHPPTTDKPYYVITFIEPFQNNIQALGLNIAFEENRMAAADLARDSGKPVITRAIELVQDNEKTPGFLLLHPMYQNKMPTNTVAQRQAAFRGWIYAPFVARNFLHDLTNSQNYTLNMRIYDGVKESPDALIYSSNGSSVAKDTAKYQSRKHLNVIQQKWLVVWESTSAYERSERNNSPLFILIGGLIFTAMFTIYLIATNVQNMDTMEWIAGRYNYVLPVLIFVVATFGSYVLYGTLKKKELSYVQSLVEEEANKVELLLSSKTTDRVLALQRLARRWDVAGGTPYKLWQDDAKSYTHQLVGLKTLEWVDSSYHVRWVEPLLGNEEAVDLDVLFNAEREAALKGAAEKNSPTMTPPIDLVQGYKAFIAYIPLHVEGRFDGFIAGVFSIDEFFRNVLTKEIIDNYAFYISYDGVNQFVHVPGDSLENKRWAVEKYLRIYDKTWRLQIVPTKTYIESQQTSLPVIVLFAGLLIAALSALIVRYVIISRLRSTYLGGLNQLNSAILSSTDYLIVATDKNGTIVTFNKAAEDALGYTAEEVIGKKTPALWHDEAEVVVRARELSMEFYEVIEPGFEVFIRKPQKDGIESREWTFIRRDGSRFAVNLTATPLRGRDGNITGYLGVIEDITERKAQQQALVTSEETFRSAMEHASIGMALVSPDGNWLKVNDALCSILGYDEEELLVMNFQSITHAEDFPRDIEYIARVMNDEIQTYQMEKRYYHKNGQIIWALLSVSLVRDEYGHPNYFITQTQDITERKEMDRMKSEFISIVSHELRTPLTSIRGSLGLIVGAMSQEIPEKIGRLIEIAHKNSERLILLINDILDIDKIASGQMQFDFKNEFVSTLIEQTMEINQPYAHKFAVGLASSPVDTTLKIRVDAARLMQVLANLISNAAKFSQAGDRVEISAAQVGETVQIRVTDHGPGIPEEFRSRIFGKFSQADSSVTRRKGGTGLGLHISRQIVENMGGKIGFDTEVGKGSSFWVEFPLAHGENIDTTEHKPAARQEPVRASIYEVAAQRAETHKIPKILHVEDDLDISSVLAEGLRGRAEVIVATTLKEARAQLKNQSFNLIILDIGLPDGSGLDLLEDMPDFMDTAIPVLILSALETPEEIQNKVSEVVVKSRMSEARIMDTILHLINEHTP